MDLIDDSIPIFQKLKNISVGKLLDRGAQGKVFEIINQPDRIIKLSILYDVDPNQNLNNVFNRIERVYNFVIKHRPSNVVSIHDFGRLIEGKRETVYGPQRYIVYYSIQEKLLPLAEEEKKVFKTICQSVNNELNLTRPLEDILNELSCWFEFNKLKINAFMKQLSECKINNNDFHRRNIMKDASGNFKVIDMDLATLKQ